MYWGTLWLSGLYRNPLSLILQLDVLYLNTQKYRPCLVVIIPGICRVAGL
jgi:hypothetical protein